MSKYFMANGLRIAEMIGSTIYYYHQDILGSTRLLSTSTPVATQFSSNYVPYGPYYGSAGTEVFQYTGKAQDSITGYYNFGARYYDPSIGRFITQDSNPGVTTDPQSMNRYVYARNNPEKRIDPNGHASTLLLDSQYDPRAFKTETDYTDRLRNGRTPTVVSSRAVGCAGVTIGGVLIGAAVAGALFPFGGESIGVSIGGVFLSGQLLDKLRPLVRSFHTLEGLASR